MVILHFNLRAVSVKLAFSVYKIYDEGGCKKKNKKEKALLV